MDDSAVLLTRHKLDVDAYHRMAEAGILGENDRIELIDGELIDMAPIGQAHFGTVNRLNHVLTQVFGDRAVVAPQNPIRLDCWNEPQPDFAILRPRADFYATGDWPGPADLLLLIEVADSSLRFDRTVKLPLYARAGIAQVWIVDLKHRTVDDHRNPTGEGYGEAKVRRPGETLSLVRVPDVAVDVSSILG